jgi:hypothetical protein
MPTLSSFRLIAILCAAAALFAAGWYVNGLIWEKRSNELLKEQEAILIGQCNDQKKITEETSNAYQKKLRAADRRLAELKRMYGNATVPITSKTNGSDAAATAIDSRTDAIAASSLIELAAECDGYQAQVSGLQDFINRIWDSK